MYIVKFSFMIMIIIEKSSYVINIHVCFDTRPF